MRFLASFVQALAGGLAAVILMFLAFKLANFRFDLWMMICVTACCALAIAIKEQWQLSRGRGSALIGAMAALGVILGTLLTTHA
jgi:hypothetical protein